MPQPLIDFLSSLLSDDQNLWRVELSKIQTKLKEFLFKQQQIKHLSGTYNNNNNHNHNSSVPKNNNNNNHDHHDNGRSTTSSSVIPTTSTSTAISSSTMSRDRTLDPTYTSSLAPADDTTLDEPSTQEATTESTSSNNNFIATPTATINPSSITATTNIRTKQHEIPQPLLLPSLLYHYTSGQGQLTFLQLLLAANYDNSMATNIASTYEIFHNCSSTVALDSCDDVIILQSVYDYLCLFPSAAAEASLSDGNLPLHIVCKLGNFELVKLITHFNQQALSTENDKGKTPLHIVAKEGNVDIARFLLQICPEAVKHPTNSCKIPLHYAASEGHFNMTKYLLEAYPSGASAHSATGKVPLHLVCKNSGCIDTVKLLLSTYADGSKDFDVEYSLPMHEAAEYGNEEALMCLLRHSFTTLKVRNGNGDLPIDLAIRSHDISKESITEMLRVYADGGLLALKRIQYEQDIALIEWPIIEVCLEGALKTIPNTMICKYGHLDVRPEQYLKEEVRQNNPMSVDVHLMSKYKYRHYDPQLTEEENNLANNDSLATASLSLTERRDSSPLHLHDDQLECDESHVNNNQHRHSHHHKHSHQQQHFQHDHSHHHHDHSHHHHHYHAHNDDRLPMIDWQPPEKRARPPLHLHLILEISTCSSLIDLVWAKYQNEVSMTDDLQRFPLHIASYYCSHGPTLPTTLSILDAHQEAASKRDSMGRLPIHHALCNKDVDLVLVKALGKANPISCVEDCDTLDEEFSSLPPVFVAAKFDCSVDVIYYLLQRDPIVFVSSLLDNQHCSRAKKPKVV